MHGRGRAASPVLSLLRAVLRPRCCSRRLLGATPGGAHPRRRCCLTTWWVQPHVIGVRPGVPTPARSMPDRPRRQAFREGTVRLLIATDVAARGLDISGLPCVVNMTLPDRSEDYIHRVGRVGARPAPPCASAQAG